MFFPDQKWSLQQGIWLAVCISVDTTFLKKIQFYDDSYIKNTPWQYFKILRTK